MPNVRPQPCRQWPTLTDLPGPLKYDASGSQARLPHVRSGCTHPGHSARARPRSAHAPPSPSADSRLRCPSLYAGFALSSSPPLVASGISLLVLLVPGGEVLLIPVSREERHRGPRLGLYRTWRRAGWWARRRRARLERSRRRPVVGDQSVGVLVRRIISY